MRHTLDGHEFEPFGPDTSQDLFDEAGDLSLEAGQPDHALRPRVATGITKVAELAWKLGGPVQRAGGDVPSALYEQEPGQLKFGRWVLAYTRDDGRSSQSGGT